MGERLDDPIWHALTTEQVRFAQRDGDAARLLAAQLALVRGAGAGVFLHVKADNARAIALYERLGFRGRRRFRYLVLRRSGP